MRHFPFPAFVRSAATLLTAVLLAACAATPQAADPALWRVEGAQGEVGWLFGTIHSSDKPLAWQTPPVREALGDAGTIMVEVGNLADEAQVSATFARLARSSGQPPLSQRVEPGERPALLALIKKAGLHDGDFTAMDTWAAALTLAKGDADRKDARNGVDRAVIAGAGSRPVVELEGAERQLGLFDSLPEKEQRDLLVAIVREATTPERDISESWRKGDMQAITAETRSGLLSDPELREALFVGRNRDWTGRIASAVRAGQKPFVAVGAAHMAGPEGLPAMLASEGFTVTRVE